MNSLPTDPNAATGLPTTPQAPRPSVLSLAIKEKAALYAAYMPFLKNGGMFVPTNKPYKIGDEIYLILSLMDDPNTSHPFYWSAFAAVGDGEIPVIRPPARIAEAGK